MSKNKFVYEVVEENKEDALETKIVKRNVDVEFTMAELKDHESRVDGMMTEVAKKIEMEKAAMGNVETHHMDAVSLVNQLEPLKQHALLLWLRSYATVLELEPKLVELQKVFDEHNEEVKDIIKQTGWVAPDMHVTLGNNDTEPDQTTEESKG